MRSLSRHYGSHKAGQTDAGDQVLSPCNEGDLFP